MFAAAADHGEDFAQWQSAAADRAKRQLPDLELAEGIRSTSVARSWLGDT